MKNTSTELIKPTLLLVPQTLTTSAVTPGVSYVDCQGYDEAMVIVSFGAMSGTWGTPIAVQVVEGATTTPVTAISGAVLQYSTGTTAYAGTDDNKTFTGRLDLRKRLRYLAVTVATPTAGSSPSAVVSVLIVLMCPNVAPVTQEQTLIAFNI